MKLPLPTAALLLGIGGLIPFAACGFFAVATVEPIATTWLLALVFYGAVILSFLGGVQWGLALSDARTDLAPGSDRAGLDRLRFGLGVVPSLIGWGAAFATMAMGPEVALAILIGGFAATLITETRLHRRALLPSGYLWLRWGLSLAVIAVLVAVLVLRLMDAHIGAGQTAG